MAALFDDVIFSCDVGILKPDRKIYEQALERLNVKPEECMFVGDGGSSELQGAKAVGMRTVFTEALEVKSNAKKSIIMEYADYCIKEFGELLTICHQLK